MFWTLVVTFWMVPWPQKCHTSIFWWKICPKLILKRYEFFTTFWTWFVKNGTGQGLLSTSFSMCPMATILFSTASVKSGECFENKRHGHSCSEKFCTASRSEICPKVSEQSQTPKFEIFWIFGNSYWNRSFFREVPLFSKWLYAIISKRYTWGVKNSHFS